MPRHAPSERTDRPTRPPELLIQPTEMLYKLSAYRMFKPVNYYDMVISFFNDFTISLTFGIITVYILLSVSAAH